jgi:hypothetical protein
MDLIQVGVSVTPVTGKKESDNSFFLHLATTLNKTHEHKLVHA